MDRSSSFSEYQETVAIALDKDFCTQNCEVSLIPYAFTGLAPVDFPNSTDYFASCHRNSSNFDNCLKDAFNDVRPFFKTGVPQYGVAPFDPFFARSVQQKGGGPNMNYKLQLKDVYESGWTISEVTRLKSDLYNNMITYSQFFPDKRLRGGYEIRLNILGNRINNRGTWNLTLFDYAQTSTITRKPRKADNGTLVYDTPIKAVIKADSCRDMELHISNLLGEASALEPMLDQIINAAWQPGFIILQPLINDLVSTAFTEIFTKNFQHFPFHEVIP